MLLYQTHALVHLQNIKANILNIRKLIGESCKILIAVKANAYGHGAVQVAQMAQDMGVDFLGVATIPEAIELRKAKIKLPILKFSPTFLEELSVAIEYDVTLSVCSMDSLKQIQELAKVSNKQIKIHLKIDTGMGRVGIAADLISEFVKQYKTYTRNILLEGVFTHFPVSDMPAYNDVTSRQIAIFEQCTRELETDLGSQISIKHTANSGAVLGHFSSYFSMVRPGIMIYGFYPDSTTPHTIDLLPGMSLYSKVSYVKKVEAGTPIGYGQTWITPCKTNIATIPIGYADGFNRLFSNKGNVLICGKRYPLVGRVCMDQCMVNLGSDDHINVGDKVTLIGSDQTENISVDDWANMLGTITYEVTCQINARVQRLYEGS